MTAPAISLISASQGEPEGRPPEALFWSPLGLFDFQAEGVAKSYTHYSETPGEKAIFAIWDTGLGKTPLALATACLMVEDGILDHLIVVAEGNKVSDWSMDDIPGFTRLGVETYSGPPARREKVRQRAPQALVMTYETSRNDICTFKPRSHAIAAPGPLTAFLQGKRTMVVFDEFSRLRKRTNKAYIAWDYLINRVLRRDLHSEVYVMGLTGTPVEASPLDHWNAGRIIAPTLAGTVAYCDKTYVASYDNFGNPYKFKNLTTENCEPGAVPLNRLFASVTLRKRKTDPDVIDQFPQRVERHPTWVTLEPTHQDLVEQVDSIYSELDEHEQRSGFTLLRQLVGDPISLLRSSGQAAQQIIAAVGAEWLTQLGTSNAKVQAMLEWQEQMAQQQTVIFTFFGQSILPTLHDALLHAGYSVSINHGQMDDIAKKASRDAFRAGDTQVFLSSDAGAKGLNLEAGSGLLHYELPIFYSTFQQRSDRIHRIVSKHPSITIDSLIAKDTIEENVMSLMLRRNQWSDSTIGDSPEEIDPGTSVLTADLRRRLFRSSREAA